MRLVNRIAVKVRTVQKHLQNYVSLAATFIFALYSLALWFPCMNDMDWLFRKKFPVGILANGKEAPVGKLFEGCVSHWVASLASSSNMF